MFFTWTSVLLILEGSKSLTYALINLSKQVSCGYFYIYDVIVTFVNISSKSLNKAGMSNKRYPGLKGLNSVLPEAFYQKRCGDDQSRFRDNYEDINGIY